MSDEIRQALGEAARRVRAAQRRLGGARAPVRTAVLRRLSTLLAERRDGLLAASLHDLEAAEAVNLPRPLLDRLRLSEAKLETLRAGVEQLAAGPDPIGRVLRRTELDSDLVLEQVTSPLGVLLVIFESRPDAVIQIGALAMRSGNGVILKGGAEARRSNRALVECLRDALAGEGFDPEAVLGIESREEATALLALDGLIDVVIPRGSGDLVRAIQAATRIPVLGHAEGVCHLYLDRAADLERAIRLALDGKTDYPAACNATETLLVHREFLPCLPAVGRALAAAGVRLRADEAVREYLPEAEPAGEEDWGREYGDLILAVRAVGSLEGAVEHIHRYGSAHTDAIVTEDPNAAAAFLARVDSASVFHNASTRFADGYRYGLGAEVGIATGRLHARGPVGVEGLLTTRWLLRGAGHAVADYGPGKRSFTHRPLPVD